MSFADKYKAHRRTVSVNDACLASGGENGNQSFSSIAHDEMIGHRSTSKTTRHLIPGLSSTWSGKAPKVPQPEQTLHIFKIVSNSIRKIIELVKSDYESLKFAADASSISSHQIKAAKRYLKELEFHLSKLEELQEKYEVQQKMREGIRSMAYAYILSNGKGRDSALHNVHSGYKECNELLCSYESKLQSMMGTFIFEMIGIQGFARMCCGDIFEIIIKHGDQKWKTRGHVLKNGKQSWENKRILFKSYFCEPLYIKAVEVRGLGKNIVLGNKYCETKDLFSAHPQQMVINLNTSGSLKLTLVITWNPVHGISEEINALPPRGSLYGSESVLNCNSKASDSEKESSIYTDETGSKKSTNYPNPQVWPFSQSAIISDSNSIEISSSTDYSSSVSCKLQEILCSLSSSLENLGEQYPDLNMLYSKVLEIEKLLKLQQQSALGSDVSISVKNALGCFDFLNAAVDGDELDFSNELDSESEPGKVAYSGSSIMSGDLGNGDNSTNSLAPSPLPLTSGIEQLDNAIIAHGEYCLNLTEKLCSCSPLKFFEVLSLEKLRKQADYFSAFLKFLRRSGKNNKHISCCDFFPESDQPLRHFWMQLVEMDSIIAVVEQFLPALQKTFHLILSNENINVPSKVAVQVLSKMLDKAAFSPETVVTIFHFQAFFTDSESVDLLIQKAAMEVNAIEEIKSGKPIHLKSAFSRLKAMLPFSNALHEICIYMLKYDSKLRDLCEAFLKDLVKEPTFRKQVIAAYLEGLENQDSKIRQGSCAALHILEASCSYEQLAYLSCADPSSEVRQEAKSAIQSFGAKE